MTKYGPVIQFDKQTNFLLMTLYYLIKNDQKKKKFTEMVNQ